MENIIINGKNIKCSKVIKDEIEYLRIKLNVLNDLTSKFYDLDDELHSAIIENIEKRSKLIRELKTL